MPVVSDPCSCQSDCFVCGRAEELPHDCAIHVLLESMVFQERMLHGEPTEAKLEEILKNGKEYLPLAMLMTDENSIRWKTMYNYVKRGFPQHQLLWLEGMEMDQIMASVSGDCSQLPPAHTQEPQLLDTVPSLFDESNDLISFLDNFETEFAIEQHEAPMELTMNRRKKKEKKTTGFKVIEPLNLSPDRVTYYEQDYPYTIIFEPNFGVHIPRSFGKTVIVFTSHLDLIWDKGFELRFFQECRPSSHRVWEAYQPQTTDAYSFYFTDCSRVADEYVKWLTWLDDWEMHRVEHVPWRMVGLQPWKRALEKHVQCSHEKALANGMPFDVTILEHI
ncbi:uncharacterized protein TNCV_4877061 [Trichonephila clavipes]|nr:uncharacterized protein TNCV_4877061 [Trichonephila clavipes]